MQGIVLKGMTYTKFVHKEFKNLNTEPGARRGRKEWEQEPECRIRQGKQGALPTGSQEKESWLGAAEMWEEALQSSQKWLPVAMGAGTQGHCLSRECEIQGEGFPERKV